MMADAMPKYVIVSFVIHVLVLMGLVFNIHFLMPLPVVENTNKQDVISAVILGDVQTSTILPRQPVVQSAPPKLKTIPKELSQKIISIKEEEKNRERLAKELLADIEKQNKKQKQLQQKKLQARFEKLLQTQAEKSLRQQLLNEDIKIKGTQTRQSKGEINKYKALILQVISEHWIVPVQSNKKLYCELMIRLAPGGMVLDVAVTKSSGDPALDHSARAAVLKSSPLPVPNDSIAFEAFRQFVLKVKPEHVVNS